MRAFTLVEVVIASSIFFLLVAAVFVVLNTSDIAYNRDLVLLELQQQARQTMQRIARELREATTEGIGECIDSKCSRITFTTLSETGMQFYRNPSNNLVIREYPAGTQQAIGHHINSLSFCCWHDSGSCNTTCSSSNMVVVELNASASVRGGSLSYPLKERVRLRNE